MDAENITNWLQTLEGLLPLVVIVLASAMTIGVTTIIVLNLLDFLRLRKQKAVFIELTPPAQTDKTPDANQRLFSVLHGMEGGRSVLDKMLRHKVAFSLEKASTREGGIRYVWRVPQEHAEIFEQTIASHLPDAKFKRVEDFLPTAINHKQARVLSFKQTGYFAYPLHTQFDLERHDPEAYINGAMTQLKPGELIAFQAVVSPAKVREAIIVQNRLAHNEALVTQLGRRRIPASKIFDAINSVLFGILDAIGDITTPTKGHSRYADSQRRHDVAAKIKPARMLGSLEEELAHSVNYKLQQPLFRVDIRAIIITDDKQRRKQRASGIRNAMDGFKVPKYQALKTRFNFPSAIRERYRLFTFRHRLPSIFTRSTAILSAAEIADIYHFPNNQSTKTENVVKSLSKTLPAPLTLKNGASLDVILGRNHHLGSSTDIGLVAAERERHVFVIGGTGNGKTTMLEYGIIQDIRNGKGVAVIDPHGDLAERLLRYIPEDRIKDVVYFNPSDLGYPIGLNLLELPEGLEGDELLDAKDFITEAVISIMRKTFSEDDSGGHRIEYVLRNATQTALTVKDATLFTIFDLLTDGKYRRKVIRNLKNQKLKNFWSNEFGKAGNFQRVKMAAGVTAKIGRFQFSASAERIMNQPKSTINFEEILDGKILICNFAKGLIGEDTSELYGISILAKLQLAAFRRVKQKQADRKPFYLYVDEFQNFATMSFVQMLSEARKYKVFLTMAEQSTSQQEDLRMVNTILANVGTVICFRSGNPSDEELLLPLFRPYIQEGDIANLPTYNFYARMSAVLSQEPVSGETIVLEDQDDEAIAEKVIASSRTNYAVKHIPSETETTSPKTKNNKPKTTQNSDNKPND